jgi:hypothetical protein
VARSKQRIDTALKALATLDELAAEPASTIVRDASIQRFEYTFEAVWKAAQAVLLDRFGVELASPKPVIRACFENSLLSESDTRNALAMVLADEIFAAISTYRCLMRAWLERLVANKG